MLDLSPFLPTVPQMEQSILAKIAKTFYKKLEIRLDINLLKTIAISGEILDLEKNSLSTWIITWRGTIMNSGFSIKVPQEEIIELLR